MNSRIYNLIEEGKIPTTNNGVFEICVPIVIYDYARCFIAKNNNYYYAFLEIENGCELYGWNVTKVTLDDINEVNCGNKPVQSLFLNKESFVIFFKHGAIAGEIDKVDGFFGEYAIQGELFAKNFCDMDSVFDYHGFAADAIESNSNKLSVVFQSKKGCSTNSFFKIVNYFNSICKNLSNPLDIMNSTMTVVHASTVVTFTFSDGENGLFDGDNCLPPSSSEAISELGNMLSTVDSSLLLANQTPKTEKILKKYNKLIEEFDRTDDPQPKIVISSPSMSMPVSYQMSSTKTKKKKEAVIQALSFIKESSSTEVEKRVLEGLLTGIITSNGNYFGFKTSSGSTIKGDVDFKLVGNEQFDVGGTIYRATINVVRIISKTGEVLKESNRLIGLEPIRKVDSYEQINLF